MVQPAKQEEVTLLDSFEDPLHASVRLPLHHVLFPLGFPLSVKSNEPAVIRAAESSWGWFHQRYRVAPIELRILASEVYSRRRPPIPTFRAQANLLTLIADRDNFGCCDLASGFGFANVTKAATTHGYYIRYYFLDAMVYTLLDTRHLIAIHSACVEFQGRGVLLIGASGAGKSSLLFATYMAFQYMSEPCLLSMLMTRVNETERGGASALNFLTISLAGSLAALVAGYGMAHSGYRLTIAILAGIITLSAVIFRIIVRE